MTELTGPTSQSERIQSLDVLRGFAVLGILVMNIQAFSSITAAYMNPTAYGDPEGIDAVVWFLSHLFFDLKMLAIFSMLFGAGMVLMAQRLEERGKRPAPIHYRRTFILLLFGIAHGALLWTGDILYSYAMCGFLVFLFRRRKPRTLLILGLLTLAVGSLISMGAQLSLPTWPEEAITQFRAGWDPNPEQISAELQAYRGGWAEQNVKRIPQAVGMWTGSFLFYLSWRAGGMMLLGMALFKLGVFSARLPAALYRRMILAGVLIGLPLILGGVWFQRSREWAFDTGFFGGMQFNYWGSIPVALGWVGVVMLFCQSRPGSWLHRSLAATGQMALTNYLMQTVLCTTIFFGHGFGLFGSVGRAEQLLVVFAVWGVQLLWSPWWLQRFRFGPFEWLWRTLTYWRLQPLRR